jgi:outer membrane receptor protein involved in Fe transport
MNFKLSYAITAVLGLASVSLPPLARSEPTDPAGDTIGEIIVTAQRRSETIQNVPISMQAITAKSLNELNISTFDDYAKLLPNVTTADSGPGQNEIFMRGLSVGSAPSGQGSGTSSPWPNVAIYLDNQSGQLPGRNLDVYAADLNRIEVLEGPQGTLFGSGAQAGVVRYITNEPKLNVTEGSVKAGYGVTAHGDPNTDLTAVLNLPLIENAMAIRAVIYSDQRGGYINNVPATFTRKDTDLGIHYANYATACSAGAPTNGACPGAATPTAYGVPPGSPVINNYGIARNAINPVAYKGTRVEALYKFNDDWDVLVSQSYQSMDSDGVFYQQPNASDGAPLNRLEVTLFNPPHDLDKFESTSWTINGRVGALKAVYTGGYLVRKVDQVGDYTNYARGVYADYYQCMPTGAIEQPTCYSPSAIWRSVEKNEHLQNEFRLSTPDDWRLRGIVGLYLEDNKVSDQTDWRYKTVPSCTASLTTGCFGNIGTVPGTTVANPGVRDGNSSFYQDGVRDTKQTAAFASFDFDIIPKVLTVTAGTRYFNFRNSLKGSLTASFYCANTAPSPTGCHVQASDVPPGAGYSAYNLDAAGLASSERGFRSRANVTWHVTPDAMLYATFSQGFRPGSFNVTAGALHTYGSDGVPQYAIPKGYLSDDLTNYEVGWKTEFLNRRLQWNGAIYQENWNNVQTILFDPGLVGNVSFNTNGPNYRTRGLETSIVARVMPGLTLQGAASWNHSEQTNSPGLISNNPASASFGKTITQVCSSSGTNCGPVTQPFGLIGSPTANSPPLQFNFRARYEWTVGDYLPFVQIGVVHTGHSYTQAGANPPLVPGQPISTSRLRFEDPAYSTYSGSFGVSKDRWTFTIYGENLSNSNATTYTSTSEFNVEQTPLRPRVIGGSFSYAF